MADQTTMPAGDDVVSRFVIAEQDSLTPPEMLTDGSGRPVLRGIGVPYNSTSKVVGRVNGMPVREIIRPGAFTDVLRSQREMGVDVVSFYNHEPNMILARESAGTLLLTEDEQGVHYEIVLPRTSYAADLEENVRAGNVRGASFMFSARAPGLVVKHENGSFLRDVRRASSLLEIGPVVSPAYEQTDCNVAARSVEEWMRSGECQTPTPPAGLSSARRSIASLAIARMRFYARAR